MNRLKKIGYLAATSAIGLKTYKTFNLPDPVDFRPEEMEKRKIAVIGGGVIGLSQAYYLSLDPKNEVTLVEKHD